MFASQLAEIWIWYGFVILVFAYRLYVKCFGTSVFPTRSVLTCVKHLKASMDKLVEATSWWLAHFSCNGNNICEVIRLHYDELNSRTGNSASLPHPWFLIRKRSYLIENFQRWKQTRRTTSSQCFGCSSFYMTISPWLFYGCARLQYLSCSGVICESLVMERELFCTYTFPVAKNTERISW